MPMQALILRAPKRRIPLSNAKDMKPDPLSLMRYLIPPLPRKYARALRMAAWNALFIISGLLLIALVGEIYLRLANPFLEDSIPRKFVDGVGLIREPNAELRHAKWEADNFVVSHTNSQGFLDREPVSPERAAAGCHIAFIGDSFVEAKEAPIPDKFHVRLEEMAARELPHLAITAQAYGIGNTGQIHQIPFYDEYARRLKPNLLILVFFLNDFADNSTALYSLAYGLDPDRMPHMSAQRDESGAIKLRPPDPEYARFLLPELPKAWHENAIDRLVRVSYFAKWVDLKRIAAVRPRINAIRARIGASAETDPQVAAWANIIAARPCCASLLGNWQPARWRHVDIQFTEEHLPPILEEELEYTAFGIDQFKRRADRDGAKLAILSASAYMGTRDDPQFDRLSAIAEARGIPVFSDYDYIVRQGHDAGRGRFYADPHWNAVGHQWVAEAVLEWLKQNQEVCD